MMRLVLSRMSMKTTKINPNQYDFLDLIRPPTGNEVSMTAEEKQKINLQITKKMQQLQDTGLSREQILLSKSQQKGLPLAIDPFFQFLKKNKIARQVYLKPGDRFSVEKIIDIALRQDIGPDSSYSRTRNHNQLNEKGRAEIMNDLPDQQRGSFDPTSYYANQETNLKKLEDELKPNQPLRHIFKPISQYERIKTHRRKLKKYDIHWRNVELLLQFITLNGNIKNRLRNRLSGADQKKVKMAIKTARHNLAIPYYGRILKPNKRNITSIDDEAKEIGLQNVNIETGQIFYSPSRSMDSIQAQTELKSDLDWKYEQMLAGNNFQLWIETPDSTQTDEVVNAQRYARALKSKQNELHPKEKNNKKLEMRKMALRKLTGLSEQQQIIIPPNDSQQCKASFESRKAKSSKAIQQNLFQFDKIIIEEKVII